MTFLAKYTKQSAETLDYDISFVDWLAALSDAAISHVASADAGITLVSSALTAGVVKVWLSGGTSGEKYKVTVAITTATSPARVKEADILITVKDD